MKIKILDDIVVNKIAAGEVVERPVSVVRELFDNAVDAGADDIRVEIEGGGAQAIIVADNGCGMSRDDALLAFERHATSKISSEEDLESLDSLGFRGEALPSIAAVSKVLLRTRTESEDSGHEVSFHGGVYKGIRSAAIPKGTQIDVRDLFFNVPARKKFLKSEQTENQKIKNWLQQAALAHPKIRISLLIDGKSALLFPRAEDFIARVKQNLKSGGVDFYHEDGPIVVEGLVAHPGLAQADSAALVLLVNRRVVNDKLIFRAVREGFDSMLKDREVPVGAISISIPGTEVDVNVHPQKSEVRFRSHQAVFGAVRDAVKDAVVEFKAPAQLYSPSISAPQRASYQPAHSQNNFAFEPLRAENQTAPFLAASRHTQYGEPRPEPCQPNSFRYRDLKFIGQTLNCFLLCEYEGFFCAVDMHAAHERTTFAELRRRFEAGQPQSQTLLVPQAVSLVNGGARNVLARQEMLSGFGIVVEEFGEDSVIVRAAPPFISGKGLEAVIKETAALPEDEDAAGPLKERIDHMATRIACHASIRSGEKLAREEVYALFELMDEVELSGACPHGRPVAAVFSRDEIERWFGRDR